MVIGVYQERAMGRRSVIAVLEFAGWRLVGAISIEHMIISIDNVSVVACHVPICLVILIFYAPIIVVGTRRSMAIIRIMIVPLK